MKTLKKLSLSMKVRNSYFITVSLISLFHIDCFILASMPPSCPEKCECNFDNEPGVTTLTISCIWKQLTSVPNFDKIDFKNSTLVDLNLSQNTIFHLFHTSLYPLLGKLRSLEILDNRVSLALNVNVFKRISRTLQVFKVSNWNMQLFDGLRYLTSLVKLETVQISTSSIQKRQGVHLIRVNHKIDKPSFPFVKSLNLGDCAIENFSEDFFYDFTGLRSLFLDNNKLKSIPEAVQSLLISGLEILDLQFNQIETIHSSEFPYLCKLERLNLQNNRIYQISSAVTLGKCPYLSEVIFSENIQLDLEPNEASILKGLGNVRLDLTNTSVQSLHQLKTHQVREIIVRGSIIPCDCGEILFYFWKFGYRMKGSCLSEKIFDVGLMSFMIGCMKEQALEGEVNAYEKRDEESLDLNYVEKKIIFDDSVTKDVLKNDNVIVMPNDSKLPEHQLPIIVNNIDNYVDTKKEDKIDKVRMKNTITKINDDEAFRRPPSLSHTTGNFRKLISSVMSSVSRFGTMVGITNMGKEANTNPSIETYYESNRRKIARETESNSDRDSLKVDINAADGMLGNGLCDITIHPTGDKDLDHRQSKADNDRTISDEDCESFQYDHILHQLLRFCTESKLNMETFFAHISKISEISNTPLFTAKILTEFDHFFKTQTNLCNDLIVKFQSQKTPTKENILSEDTERKVKENISTSQNIVELEAVGLNIRQNFKTLLSKCHSSDIGHVDKMTQCMMGSPNVLIDSKTWSVHQAPRKQLNYQSSEHIELPVEPRRTRKEGWVDVKQNIHTQKHEKSNSISRHVTVKEQIVINDEKPQNKSLVHPKKQQRHQQQKQLQQEQEQQQPQQQPQKEQQEQQQQQQEQQPHQHIMEHTQQQSTTPQHSMHNSKQDKQLFQHQNELIHPPSAPPFPPPRPPPPPPPHPPSPPQYHQPAEQQHKEDPKLDNKPFFKIPDLKPPTVKSTPKDDGGHNTDEMKTPSVETRVKKDVQSLSMKKRIKEFRRRIRTVEVNKTGDKIVPNNSDENHHSSMINNNDNKNINRYHNNYRDDTDSNAETDYIDNNDDDDNNDNDGDDYTNVEMKTFTSIPVFIAGLIYASLVFGILNQLSTTVFVDLCVVFENLVVYNFGASYSVPKEEKKEEIDYGTSDKDNQELDFCDDNKLL